jgi:hypothetical protein
MVKRILYALAAKTPVPPILSALLTAREVAVNGSGVSDDADSLHMRGPFPKRRTPQIARVRQPLAFSYFVLPFLIWKRTGAY